MSVFGYQIEIQLLLQLVTTAVLIGLYATMTSLREQKADHLSDCHMVLLASFIFKHHASVKDLKALTEAPESAIDEANSTLWHFSTRLNTFRADGSLPDFSKAASTTLLEHVWIVLLAPVMAIALVVVSVEEGRYGSRIQHTEIRKNYFSKGVILVAANVLFVVVSAEFVVPSWPTIGALLVIAAAAGIAGALIDLSVLVAQQQAWKGYWSDRLLEVMASADREQNHDLFNRAMILAHQMESQPDVPLPGRLGFYAAVYSGVQAVIIFGSEWLKSA